MAQLKSLMDELDIINEKLMLMNRLLNSALEKFEELPTRDAEQRDAPTEAGGDWVCIKCKTRNGDNKSICGFCDTPRLGG